MRKLLALLIVCFYSIQAVAECSTDDIISLAKQGYQKSEINKMCTQPSNAKIDDKIASLFLNAIKKGTGANPPSFIGDWPVSGHKGGLYLHQEVAYGDVSTMNRLCTEVRKSLDVIAKKTGGYIEERTLRDPAPSDDCRYRPVVSQKIWSLKINNASINILCFAGIKEECSSRVPLSPSSGGVEMELRDLDK